MSDWLEVDARTIGKDQTESRGDRGVQIQLALSPYDVPEAVRGFFDVTRQLFVIEFRYIQEEPWTSQKANHFLNLRIGKNSRRLYGVEIDVVGLRAAPVGLRLDPAADIKAALAKLTVRSDRPARNGNYKVLESIVDRQAGSLFQDLPAAISAP